MDLDAKVPNRPGALVPCFLNEKGMGIRLKPQNSFYLSHVGSFNAIKVEIG